MRRASSAYQRNWSTQRPHSRPDWAMGLPVSKEIIRAASSVRRSISSAIRCIGSARVKAGIADHAARPACAAAIAAAVSASVATGQFPSESSVTGLKTGAVAPLTLLRHSPAMKSPNGAYIKRSPSRPQRGPRQWISWQLRQEPAPVARPQTRRKASGRFPPHRRTPKSRHRTPRDTAQ